MKLVYLLPILIVFVLTPAFGYNSGFRPIYQPNLPSGGSPIGIFCSLGDFINSYNSTTMTFTCLTGGSAVVNDPMIDCAGNVLETLSLNNSTGQWTYNCIAGGSGEANTMSSPTHANSLVLTKTGVDLPIKGIACGGSIVCSSNSTDVTLSFTETPGGSGFDTIASSPQTTATILADNSTITNTATIKTLTQGTGITLTNGSNAVTVATNFKIDTQSTIATDSFLSGFDNSTGDWTQKTFSVNTQDCGSQFVKSVDNSTGYVTCASASGGSTPRGGYLVGMWTQSQTKTNIGTAFVDVYTQTNSNGKAVFIDTDTFTQVRLQIQWNKVGAGTQTCQVINGATVLVSMNVVSGSNDSGFVSIPAGLLNAENSFRLQCKSTTAADDPIFESAAIWIK